MNFSPSPMPTTPLCGWIGDVQRGLEPVHELVLPASSTTCSRSRSSTRKPSCSSSPRSSALYWLIPRRWQMTRIWLLIIASFHFYASWSKDLAFLVTTTTLADYIFGRLMDATKRQKLRFAVMLVQHHHEPRRAVLLQVPRLLPERTARRRSRASATTRATASSISLSIIIPFGISFYTFEAISYTVDVYRRKIAAERNLPHFLLFILFFPHLVAGPIVRAGDFLPQTRRPKRWNWVRVQLGVQLFLMGCSRRWRSPTAWRVFCDPVFGEPGAVSAPARAGSRCSPTPCGSTATSPATPTWPSASRTCSATS